MFSFTGSVYLAWLALRPHTHYHIRKVVKQDAFTAISTISICHTSQHTWTSTEHVACYSRVHKLSLCVYDIYTCMSVCTDNCIVNWSYCCKEELIELLSRYHDIPYIGFPHVIVYLVLLISFDWQCYLAELWDDSSFARRARTPTMHRRTIIGVKACALDDE